MGKIFVAKRRAGIEYDIPVCNLGGFIETPVTYSDELYKKSDSLEALLEVETV